MVSTNQSSSSSRRPLGRAEAAPKGAAAEAARTEGSVVGAAPRRTDGAVTAATAGNEGSVARALFMPTPETASNVGRVSALPRRRLRPFLPCCLAP